MDAFILTPIAPHTLSNRPIVVPAARDVRVAVTADNGGAEVYVTFDGQTGGPLQPGDEVVVRRAARTVKLVRATTRTYFEVLRQKLKWGER
jgi:NAD+ kinase